MILMFDGEKWIEIDGPLTLGNLRRWHRTIVKPNKDSIYTLVKISKDLEGTARHLPNFVPASFYNFSVVSTENELGKVEIFIISRL